jgi:hypothetical protein
MIYVLLEKADAGFIKCSGLVLKTKDDFIVLNVFYCVQHKHSMKNVSHFVHGYVDSINTSRALFVWKS